MYCTVLEFKSRYTHVQNVGYAHAQVTYVHANACAVVLRDTAGLV